MNPWILEIDIWYINLLYINAWILTDCEKHTSLTHVADGTWRYTMSPAIEAVGADWKHKDKKNTNEHN